MAKPPPLTYSNCDECLEHLKTTNPSPDEPHCPICQLDWNLDEAVVTECGHCFHRRCLVTWIQDGVLGSKNLCPACRHVLFADKEFFEIPLRDAVEIIGDTIRNEIYGRYCPGDDFGHFDTQWFETEIQSIHSAVTQLLRICPEVWGHLCADAFWYHLRGLFLEHIAVDSFGLNEWVDMCRRYREAFHTCCESCVCEYFPLLCHSLEPLICMEAPTYKFDIAQLLGLQDTDISSFSLTVTDPNGRREVVARRKTFESIGRHPLCPSYGEYVIAREKWIEFMEMSDDVKGLDSVEVNQTQRTIVVRYNNGEVLRFKFHLSMGAWHERSNVRRRGRSAHEGENQGP